MVEEARGALDRQEGARRDAPPGPGVEVKPAGGVDVDLGDVRVGQGGEHLGAERAPQRIAIVARRVLRGQGVAVVTSHHK